MMNKHIIEKLTHQADARLSGPSGPFYVPGLIQGEEVVVDDKMHPTIITPSPDRVSPICADAELCGGCDLQHMNKQAQAFFKQQVVAQALQRQSLPLAAMKPIRQASKPQRRRARWTINQHGTPCMHQKKSHALVAPANCHILDEELEDLRRLLADMHLEAGLTSGHLQATQCDNGIQLDYGRDCQADWDILSRRLAKENMISGVFHGQKQKFGAPGFLDINGHQFTLRPGVFLQPCREAADIMTELVLAEISTKQHMLELFCGIGTFTAHLATLGKVDAFEGNKTATDILSSAIPKIANITTRQRDLFKHPLSKAELVGYDLVLLDPPRDGARRQAEELAQAPTNKIIYVSCNPVTFARDGRILQEGGYQLHKVTPVDQFWHAHHVELVAVFSRW